MRPIRPNHPTSQFSTNPGRAVEAIRYLKNILLAVFYLDHKLTQSPHGQPCDSVKTMQPFANQANHQRHYMLHEV